MDQRVLSLDVRVPWCLDKHSTSTRVKPKKARQAAGDVARKGRKRLLSSSSSDDDDEPLISTVRRSGGRVRKRANLA